MEPEISHRCPACGVAVRGTSLFCPQCGRPLKAGATNIGNQATEATEPPALRKSDTGLNTSVIAPSPDATETAPGKEVLKSEASAVERRAPVGATRPLDREVEERSSRQRVTALGRDG